MKTRVIQGDSSSPPERPDSPPVPVGTPSGDGLIGIRTGRTGSHVLRVAQVARPLREKIPFTLSVAFLTLLAGVAAASLWRPLPGPSPVERGRLRVPRA